MCLCCRDQLIVTLQNALTRAIFRTAWEDRWKSSEKILTFCARFIKRHVSCVKTVSPFCLSLPYWLVAFSGASCTYCETVQQAMEETTAGLDEPKQISFSVRGERAAVVALAVSGASGWSERKCSKGAVSKFNARLLCFEFGWIFSRGCNTDGNTF